MTPTPIGNRVLIRPDEKPDMVGRLYVPESAPQEAVRFGTVVAVGPGAVLNGDFYECQCEPGDQVAYRHHRGTTVEYDGVDYVVLQEGDVLCIFPQHTAVLITAETIADAEAV